MINEIIEQKNAASDADNWLKKGDALFLFPPQHRFDKAIDLTVHNG